MKQLFGIFITLLVICSFICGINCKLAPAFAADGDMWDNFNTDIQAPKDSKFVSDDEFEQAIKKKNKRIDKWKNILLDRGGKPRGEVRYQSNETEEISKNEGEDASLPILSTPAEIKIGEGVIPVGHYQVKGEKKDGNVILSLYQAGELIARIPAVETNDDYDKDEILFAGWQPENDKSIKIIYGSLDFNAYAIVDLQQ